MKQAEGLRPVPVEAPAGRRAELDASPLDPRGPIPRAVDLLIALIRSDLRAKYGRGPWRVMKWLVDPFGLVGVYLLLVALVLDRPGKAPGLSVACAVVPFQLVMMSVIGSFDALRVRRSIVANMKFSRTFMPLASALTESVAFMASTMLFVVLMAVYQIGPTLALLWLPVVIVSTVLFAGAMAYPAALAGVWVTDVREFLISFVRTLYFIAPGLVALDEIYGHTHDVVKVNPLTGIFEAYRAVILYGEAPRLWHLAYPLAMAAVMALIFVPIYRREQTQFAKVVE